ncbi:MAG: carbohydrate ABC transporter substrate-binding protein [Anaerolineae bacterium]|nr:carbohydrate ABC transporter substrate-binding protein [Anaerolineae bacterium]
MRKNFLLIPVLGILLLASGIVAQDDDVTFLASQFNVVEEAARFREILAEGGYNFTEMSGGDIITQVLAQAESGSGAIDVVGDLHGGFPPLASANALDNLIDMLEDLEADREFVPWTVELGLLDSEDYLYYIPWMQATYIMAAHTQALEYLPEGADVNALTWEQVGEWCQNIVDETGQARCGFPYAGLFHRILEGYLWPSFTGGMVTNFRSQEAADMLAWVRDGLWPYVHPESISYDFMQDPMLAGDVWVTLDHTARLINAFNEQPEDFIAFPAPSGPAGRGFMPVLVGLSVPTSADDKEGAAALIDYLTQPDTQAQVLSQLAFFPVVGGVDASDLPVGVALEAGAVEAQANAEDAIPSLLPVGLGDRGGEINNIFRAAFDRVVINGEDIQTVLDEEGANLQALLNDTGAACWAPDPASDGACQVQ